MAKIIKVKAKGNPDGLSEAIRILGEFDTKEDVLFEDEAHYILWDSDQLDELTDKLSALGDVKTQGGDGDTPVNETYEIINDPSVHPYDSDDDEEVVVYI